MKNKNSDGGQKKIGQWKLKKQSETEVVVTLPKGMKVTGDNITVEDLLSAIAAHNAIKKGRPGVRCCSGNMAIA